MKKVALILIIFMIIIGIVYPAITPYDPEDFSFEALEPPSREHFFGTNLIGQDIYSSILAGFRTSIWIALISGAISTMIGTILAISAAYYKGWVDKIVEKLTELFIIVPEIIAVMLFAVFSGPGISNIIAAISMFSWSKAARIVRIKANIAMHKEEVQYTLLLKGNVLDVLRKLWIHIYPAVSTMFLLQCSKAILYEANLSFLGIGDPTIKSWGRTIRQALDYDGLFLDMSYRWWLIPPIACIVVFVFALSVAGFDMEKEY